MTNFIPDSSDDILLIQDDLIDKFLNLAQNDNDVNGKCLNSPYYIRHNGKVYRADCESHSPTGWRLSRLTLGNIVHVPMRTGARND